MGDLTKGDEMGKGEATFDDKVSAEVDKLKAEQDEKFRAEAAAKVKAEEDAAAAAKAVAEQEVRDAKARVDNEKARLAKFTLFCKSVGDYMLANKVEDPRSLPDVAVFDLRQKAGI